MASANWMKATTQKAGAMKKHLGQEEREHGNHSNKDIDRSLSKNNYALGCSDYSEALESMKHRTKEVDELIPPKRIRKDRVTCCFIELPCPRELTERGTSDDFFKGAYKTLCDFFGKENVHGGFVHKDEVHTYTDKDKTLRTSLEHIHVLVSAYTADKGINGKAFETRARLKALNNALDDMCLKSFGINLNTGDTPGKKSVEQLKHETELQATIQAQEAAIKEQAEILYAEPEDAPQGVPVPSMAKMWIGKENKDKILYSPDDVAAIHQLAKAAAVTAAATDRRQAELDEKSEKIVQMNAKAAQNLEKSESDRKDAEDELSTAKRCAQGIVRDAKLEAQEILKEAESEAQSLEKSVKEREAACKQREQRDQEWEKELRNREDILDFRETEPDVYYKAIIAEKDDQISDFSLNELRLSSRCESLNDKILELESRIKMLEESNDDYEKQVFSLSSDKQELENQNQKKDTQISELHKELTENRENLKEMQSNLDIKSNQLRCAIEVGEYRDDDFKSKVSMRIEDYKLSYIYGDRGYSR